MTNLAARTIPPEGSSRLAFLQKKMPYMCVWGEAGNHFIELNHLLTYITSTCAVSCDFEKSSKPQ